MNKAVKFAQIKKGKMAYEKLFQTNTESQKPVIVFLHDVLSSMKQWKNLPQELCEKTELEGLIFDRIGYGQSDPVDFYRLQPNERLNYLQDYSQNQIPEFLEQVYDKNQKIILYGHSDGATLALLMATNPQIQKQCIGVISESAHCYVDKETIQGLRQAQYIFRDNNLIEKLAKYQGDRAKMIFDFWQQTWLHPYFMNNFNILKQIQGNILCPTLYIQGKEDQFMGLEQFHKIVEQNPNEKSKSIVVENAKHFPYLEQREFVVNEHVNFIKDLLKAESS